MEMDEGARRWLIKTARENYWRVAAWYELEDLIQDGYMWYYSRVKKYPHIVDRPHMMRMFQLRFIQHIHELSNKRTKQRPESVLASLMLENSDQNPLDAAISEDDIQFFMAEAPAPICRVLKSLWDESNKTLKSVYRIRKDGSRETLNDRLCAIAGVTGVDLVKAVKDYLTMDYKRARKRKPKTT